MEKDKNSKYWGYMEQNEAVKDAIQPEIGVGKEIILLIYEHNVSQSSWSQGVLSRVVCGKSSFTLCYRTCAVIIFLYFFCFYK